ncbi:rubrerythrin family protein [Anaeromicrobium sediminis]|uniref:Rubrerythrin-2 n=1 Tax=Anaeromicrobium sediminis TaxID=1478221 RepID=A0A267MLT8_9FIRM|nr:rubrerythrin family protein [Anaeromicrobium sediminis]PAB60506.1 Rubrerythrin-2 [Anaeromicrobium sediminis]
MAVKNVMTEDYLRSSYGGESMAHMRYLTWADMADDEKVPNIGRLFRAIAYAELVHANNHFKVLEDKKNDYTVTAGAVFGRGTTVENLQGAINGELHEVEQMYPAYLQVAEFQDEKEAKRSFHFALEAEKIHAALFKDAQDAAKEGEDLKMDSVHVCPICGHTVLDEAPEKCPICGAKKEVYKSF